MKRTYQRPETEAHAALAESTFCDMSMCIYDKPIGQTDNLDDHFITDGSQILAPQVNLWDDETENDY